MKLKGLDYADIVAIQEAEIDELKKVQKEEFSEAFQKLYDRKKAYFELNVMSLPHESSIFKKISPKTFGPHGV
jgi:predicted CopG family antitoxin